MALQRPGAIPVSANLGKKMSTKSAFVLFALSALLSPILVAAEIENIVPSGLVAEESFGESVRLTWDDHTELYGTSTFQWKTLIYRNTTDQFNSARQIGSAGFHWYQDSDVESGTVYYYWIQWEERSSGKKSKVSDPIGTPEETTFVPILSVDQWHEPDIDFGALSQECPRWSDSLENCPYLLKFHGYDIYLGKNLVDNRAEIWDLDFDGLSSLDRLLLGDDEKKVQSQSDRYFYNEDPDRALSKRLLVFLAAFETVFVPESPGFGESNAQYMADSVSKLRDLKLTPNYEAGHPERIGIYIGSIRTEDSVSAGTSTSVSQECHTTLSSGSYCVEIKTTCTNGNCTEQTTCLSGNCSDGSRSWVVGFAGSGEDPHFPNCGDHGLACYNVNEFAMGFYLAENYEENLYVLRHEFGHVWHQLFVPDGYGNHCIMGNYEAAMKANRFRDYGATTARRNFDSQVRIMNQSAESPPARGSQEWLDFWNQRKGGGASYTATNHYEYFAELTAIWFGNQWDWRGYPETRANCGSTICLHTT